MTRGELIIKLRDQYAQQRSLNIQQRDERIEEATLLDPIIGELLKKNSTLLYGSVRELLGDREKAAQIVESMRARSITITSQIEKRLLALGLPADYFEMRYNCPLCKDTGYLGELQREMCACMKQQLMKLSYADHNLMGLDTQNFQTFDLSIFPDEPIEGQPISQREFIKRVRNQCIRYSDGYPATAKLNLMLMGESGLGKSFLINCIAERIISRGMTALRVSAFHMLEAMRRHHFGQTGESGSLEEMISCELLLIDDLGTEPMIRNVTIEYLFTLLNERLNARKHTVIATNLSMSEIRARYNERVASRLFDHTNSDIFILKGRDLRQRKLS